MIKRFGYRWLLPFGNLVLFVALIFAGYAIQSSNPEVEGNIAHPAEVEPSLQPTLLERPRPLPHLLAEAIDFPAVLFAMPFQHLAEGRAGEIVKYSVAALYLVFLWYMVGIWLDQRSQRTVHSTPLLSGLRWSALAASGLWLVLMLMLIFRAIPKRLGPGVIPEQICSLPALFWPLFLAYAAAWEIKHAKPATQATAITR